MSDEDPAVSRRTLLYGLATAGIGAGTGAVTGASVFDAEAFTGNLYSTGEVDIEACWEDAGASSPCTPDDGSGTRVDLGTVSAAGDGGSGLVRVRLPGNDANNPAFTWFRTSCPGDADGLERDLCVRIWRDENCNATRDQGEPVLASGTLCEVLDTLNSGVLLDGDPATSDADSLEPGEEACLGVEWVLESDTIDEPVDIDFEFHATQSRHTDPQNQNPWPGAGCDVTCPDRCNPGGISFVTLCGSGLTEGNTSVETATDEDGDLITNDEGEPIAVEWSADEPVKYVVFKNGNGKTGNNHAMFTFDVDGVTSGTARVNTVFDEPDSGGHPSNPCPGGSSGVKYEYENGWTPEDE